LLPVGALGITMSLAAACSADSSDDDGFQSTNGQGGGSTQSSGDPSGTGGDILSGTPGAGAAGSGGGCVGTGSKAEKVPLDIFIMLDQSGSMGDNNKWQNTTNAISAFVNSPEAAGIGVGLQYFGLPPNMSVNCSVPFCTQDAECGDPLCGPCMVIGPTGICLGFGAGGDSCNAADYATASVPIAPLPGNAGAITGSMGMHGPSTGTPTKPALQGAIDFAKVWAADPMNQNPPHTVIVLLATDGIPESCDTNGIDAVAAQGLADGIMTFVIGVGDSLTILNGIAAAGGSGQAYLVDANANAQAEFLAAMQDIQGKALPCAFGIPEPMQGDTIDYNEVNVEYTPSGGGMPQTIPKVNSEAECPPTGGWYYDDASPPSQIILCPASCDQLSADTEGEVNIVLGCTSIVP